MITTSTRAASSVLPDRLRAALRRAGLSHQKVATTLGYSRALVSQWLSTNPDVRTTPTAEQVMALSRLTRVPAVMLIDDATACSDIELLPDGALVVPGAAQPLPLSLQPVSTESGRHAALFWQTVQLEVISQDATLSRSFGVVVERDGVMATLPFLHRRRLVYMLTQDGLDLPGLLAQEVPKVLFAEAVLGKRCDKHLMVLAEPGSRGQDGRLLGDDLIGCTVTMVGKVVTAARLLRGLPSTR